MDGTPKRLLSIDGGGIRGIIPAVILSELEKLSGKRAGEMFDIVAGTSTGGIIACGLAAGMTASELLDLYMTRGREIFKQNILQKVSSLWGAMGPKYPASPLEKILLGALKDKKLSEIEKPYLLVPAYSQSKPGTLFFKSWQTRSDSSVPDFYLRDIARGTSAAETYFPAADIRDTRGNKYICTDGGTFANNPTLAVVSQAVKLWKGQKQEILSLGTGTNVTAYGKECLNWGKLSWAPRISTVFMDGAADTVTYYMSAFISAFPEKLKMVRVDADLPKGVDPEMDEASDKNRAALLEFGKGLFEQRKAEIALFARAPA